MAGNDAAIGRLLSAAILSSLLTFASPAAAGTLPASAALASAPAPGEATIASNPLTYGGFVDIYYAYNPNRPADHDTFFAGTGTSGERANELGLNLAALTLSRAPTPLGFDLVLNVGTGTDVVHSGEPPGEIYRAVYQASLAYATKLGRGLLIQAGVFPSHVGFEGFFSKDNWNYTRSWLGEESPYYAAGIKLAYPLSDRWSAQLHVLNGWQLISDNNDGKTIGTQLAYAGDRLNVSFNTMIGPELPHDNSSLRVFGDLWASYKLTSRLTLVGVLDAARQQVPRARTSSWGGYGVFGRYSLDERTAVALRAERFADGAGAISGTPQTLHEATVTLEHRPRPDLILKIEGRLDESTAAVFARVDGKSDRERLLLLSGVVTF